MLDGRTAAPLSVAPSFPAGEGLELDARHSTVHALGLPHSVSFYHCSPLILRLFFSGRDLRRVCNPSQPCAVLPHTSFPASSASSDPAGCSMSPFRLRGVSPRQVPATHKQRSKHHPLDPSPLFSLPEAQTVWALMVGRHLVRRFIIHQQISIYVTHPRHVSLAPPAISSMPQQY